MSGSTTELVNSETKAPGIAPMASQGPGVGAVSEHSLAANADTGDVVVMEGVSNKRQKVEVDASNGLTSKDHLLVRMDFNGPTSFLMGFHNNFESPIYYMESGNDAPTPVADGLLPEKLSHYDYRLQEIVKMSGDGITLVNATLGEMTSFYKMVFSDSPPDEQWQRARVLLKFRCEEQEAWLTYDYADSAWCPTTLVIPRDGAWMELTPAQFETRCNSHSKKWRQSFKMMAFVKVSKSSSLAPATAEQFMAFMRRMFSMRSRGQRGEASPSAQPGPNGIGPADATATSLEQKRTQKPPRDSQYLRPGPRPRSSTMKLISPNPQHRQAIETLAAMEVNVTSHDGASASPFARNRSRLVDNVTVNGAEEAPSGRSTPLVPPGPRQNMSADAEMQNAASTLIALPNMNPAPGRLPARERPDRPAGTYDPVTGVYVPNVLSPAEHQAIHMIVNSITGQSLTVAVMGIMQHVASHSYKTSGSIAPHSNQPLPPPQSQPHPPQRNPSVQPVANGTANTPPYRAPPPKYLRPAGPALKTEHQ